MLCSLIRWTAVAAISAATPALATPPTATMLVLDASGSMWTTIGKRTKIDIARDAVKNVLDSTRQDEPLGFAAYGHRRKGDCEDIEILLDPVVDSRQAIRDRLAPLRPKGMTPIGAAVTRVAESLRSRESKTTIILISDGQETCGADPCAIARALEEDGVDLTVHAIGFDVAGNHEAQHQLSCIAQVTGGRYVDAADADELRDALRSVVHSAPEMPGDDAECGEFEGAGDFLEGMATWPTGQTASKEASTTIEPTELGVDADPRDCKKLCDDETVCSAWWFEPVGSNFRSSPVCFRWPSSTALAPPAPGHDGSAMGVKSGIRQIQRAAGMACETPKPLRP